MKTFFSILALFIICTNYLYSQDNSKPGNLSSTTINQDTTQVNRQNCFFCPEDSSNYKVAILPSYFLLGTLSDYMGRFQYIDKRKQVDRYYPYEEPIINFLTEYIKINYGLVVDTIFKKSRHSEMYSKQLTQILNKFYGDDGNLIDSLFNTEEEIYSFLLGNYYRYGERLTDKIYKIQIVNSPKDKLLYPMLKKVHCDRLLYKFLRNIPSSHVFYFEAPPRLIKYFNTVKVEKEKISASYYTKIIAPIYKDNLKGKYEEYKQEEIKEIEKVFK